MAGEWWAGRVLGQTLAPPGTGELWAAPATAGHSLERSPLFSLRQVTDLEVPGWLLGSPDSWMILGLEEHWNAHTSQMKTLACPCLPHRFLYWVTAPWSGEARGVGCPLSFYLVGPPGSTDQEQSEPPSLILLSSFFFFF